MDAEKFAKDLETVVYGCHSDSHKVIRNIFERIGILTYSFTEYFLNEPVKEAAHVKDATMYMPFLGRAAMELKYSVMSTGDRKSTTFESKTRETISKVRDQGREGIKLGKWEDARKRLEEFCTNREPPWAIIKLESQDAIRKTMEDGNLGEVDAAMTSYSMQIHLWSTLENSALTAKPVHVLRLPIASNDYCYGQIVLTYQASSDDNKKLEPQLRDAASKLIVGRYVPTLILLHVSKWEAILHTKLTEIENDPAQWPNLCLPSPSPHSLGWATSKNEFESAFGLLWGRRESWLSISSQQCRGN